MLLLKNWRRNTAFSPRKMADVNVGICTFFMWKLAKKAIRTAILLLFISNETLKLGLAKWQVPEKIII